MTIKQPGTLHTRMQLYWEVS